LSRLTLASDEEDIPKKNKKTEKQPKTFEDGMSERKSAKSSTDQSRKTRVKKKSKKRSRSPQSSAGGKRSKNTLKKDADLIRSVLKQQIRGESSVFSSSDIDWDSIAAEMGGTAAHLKRKWESRVWAPLTGNDAVGCKEEAETRRRTLGRVFVTVREELLADGKRK
jgi:hypothetical protein